MIGLGLACNAESVVLLSTMRRLACALALVLGCLGAANVVGIAVAEYFLGLELFYPRGPTTTTIYAAADVAGKSHRLPATFASAHHFGNTMVVTLPLLVIRLLRDGVGSRERRFLSAAVLAT